MNKEQIQLVDRVHRLMEEVEFLEKVNDNLRNQNIQLTKDNAMIRILIKNNIKKYELKGYEATTQRFKELLRDVDENTGGRG